jgi:hypothetical protein
MKFILTLLFAYSLTPGMAQTPLIAHKSHAGTSISYFMDPSSNFGAIKIDLQPEPLINQTFHPINDSVIVREVLDYEGQIIQRDTLSNKEKYSPLIFQARYKDSIRKKELEENHKRELDQEEQLRKQQLESQEQLNEPVPTKKKKKSYLLFLFGITGGGMLLMRLFRGSKITKPSIA